MQILILTFRDIAIHDLQLLKMFKSEYSKKLRISSTRSSKVAAVITKPWWIGLKTARSLTMRYLSE